MKKFILIILIVFSALSVNAQIKRQILGYTLGVSSRSTVVQGLRNKGFDLETYEAFNQGPIFYQVKGGVSFGGVVWDDVRIGFINGKFASIMCETYLTEAQFSKINKALRLKYKRYSTNHTKPDEKVYDYNDKKTSVLLFIQYNGKATLIYSDEKLYNKNTNSSSIDDL